METAFQYARSKENNFVTQAAKLLVAKGYGAANFVSATSNISHWRINGLPIKVIGTNIYSPHFD